MLFTPDEISRIKIALGYEEFPKYEADVQFMLEVIEDQVRYERILFLLDKVEEIDSKIQQYVEKLYVEQVEGITLNYEKVVLGLKKEGLRRLKELSWHTNLDIRNSPFKGGESGFSFVAY
jgi:hypothetical protein